MNSLPRKRDLYENAIQLGNKGIYLKEQNTQIAIYIVSG